MKEPGWFKRVRLKVHISRRLIRENSDFWRRFCIGAGVTLGLTLVAGLVIFLPVSIPVMASVGTAALILHIGVMPSAITFGGAALTLAGSVGAFAGYMNKMAAYLQRKFKFLHHQSRYAHPSRSRDSQSSSRVIIATSNQPSISNLTNTAEKPAIPIKNTLVTASIDKPLAAASHVALFLPITAAEVIVASSEGRSSKSPDFSLNMEKS